jgi:predicted Zn-dependent peptidase
MINFEKFVLPNGLVVLVNEDHSTPLAAMSLLYKVGSRNEKENKTGFAHLFEHLMFGGSLNIDSFDEPLQKVGGDNNAFTSSDITNYYLTVPAENLVTGFWLESDRMLGLRFSQKSLDVQKNVVCEEFRQRYLNQPYGDAWLLLRPEAYKVHPYKWPTIGKDISHIQDATLSDVKKFFYGFYAPNNAILSVSGDVTVSQIKSLCATYFEPIESRKLINSKIQAEPPQTAERVVEVRKNVPYDALYMVYHMPSRSDRSFYCFDIISDLLSNGRSSRLYQTLVKEKQLFSDIHAYITSDVDPGLFVFSGKLMKNISMKQAEDAIGEEVEKIKNNEFTDEELQKVKNKYEANIQFGNVNIMNKAMNLCYFEMLGDASLINAELQSYMMTGRSDISSLAKTAFVPENCTKLYYYAE